MDAEGCLGELTPTRLWLGDATVTRLPASHSTLGLAPPTRPGAERRGGGRCRRGTPAPSPPASPAGPRLGRGAGAAFSLLPARSRGTL